MKKALTLLLTAALSVSMLAGCGLDSKTEAPARDGAENGKINIVATLFPQYDFARQIAGDKAEVTLLLPPGMESHSFEPTPSDIIRIDGSDLFIYTGKYMETWSQKIIDSMKDSGSHSVVLDVSKGIGLVKTADEVGHSHEGEEPASHLKVEEEPAGSESEHGSELYDPHIWTDPQMAKQMVSNILDALCGVDPANAEYYRENAENYSRELDGLDAEFKSIVSGGNRKEIIFGSRFALYYFVQRYSLEYEAAFDSCSEETEPSARTVVSLVDKIKRDKIPVIYYAEIEDPKVARAISAETGAKMLLFHSCHNVTKEEFESGATYLSLMKQNAENLKEGLE